MGIRKTLASLVLASATVFGSANKTVEATPLEISLASDINLYNDFVEGHGMANYGEQLPFDSGYLWEGQGIRTNVRVIGNPYLVSILCNGKLEAEATLKEVISEEERIYDAWLTIETPDSMYGQNEITVSTQDVGGNTSSVHLGNWFLNDETPITTHLVGEVKLYDTNDSPLPPDTRELYEGQRIEFNVDVWSYINKEESLPTVFGTVDNDLVVDGGFVKAFNHHNILYNVNISVGPPSQNYGLSEVGTIVYDKYGDSKNLNIGSYWFNIPEPSTLGLLGAGFAGLALSRRKSKDRI